jgi:hypothetical protein
MVTIINNAKENQPSTMALVPTPLRTLPFPKSCAIMEAATDAVCCQSTARAIWETGREGNGLTSRSLPEASSSSCQPGKVASRRRHMKAKMMAMMLYSRVSKDRMWNLEWLTLSTGIRSYP